MSGKRAFMYSANCTKIPAEEAVFVCKRPSRNPVDDIKVMYGHYQGSDESRIDFESDFWKKFREYCNELAAPDVLVTVHVPRWKRWRRWLANLFRPAGRKLPALGQYLEILSEVCVNREPGSFAAKGEAATVS